VCAQGILAGRGTGNSGQSTLKGSGLATHLTLGHPVFTDAPGKPADPTGLSQDFARIVKRAGLEGVRFHELRHAFASLMLMRDAKPMVISEALDMALWLHNGRLQSYN
jgi:integrase